MEETVQIEAVTLQGDTVFGPASIVRTTQVSMLKELICTALGNDVASNVVQLLVGGRELNNMEDFKCQCPGPDPWHYWRKN